MCLLHKHEKRFTRNSRRSRRGDRLPPVERSSGGRLLWERNSIDVSEQLGMVKSFGICKGFG